MRAHAAAAPRVPLEARWARSITARGASNGDSMNAVVERCAARAASAPCPRPSTMMADVMSPSVASNQLSPHSSSPGMVTLTAPKRAEAPTPTRASTTVPLSGIEYASNSAAGRVAIRHAALALRHAAAAVDRQQFDQRGISCHDRLQQQFAATAMLQQVVGQLGGNDCRTSGDGLIEPMRLRQAQRLA